MRSKYLLDAFGCGVYNSCVRPMCAAPLPFAPPALYDAAAVRDAARAARQSDLAFANVYLLRRKYGTEIALSGGFLFRHFSGLGRLRGYAFPCGSGDVSAALALVEADALARGRSFEFCLLLEEQCELLEGLYPGRFRFHADPGDADYVYERAALAALEGARFHRKRNHVERFVREFPSWRLELLSAENAQDALAVADAWLSAAEGGAALLHEREAIAHALLHREELGLFGAVLYVGFAPVAMSLLSMISPEVADVHYEKCHPDFRSAYPLINREVASLLSCRWVNREEDLNFPGLRQAKLAYFPCAVLSKFSARLC